MKIKCMIVDDEPLAVKGMEEYIADIDFLELAAVCENAVDANAVLKQKNIDLIFLDIQMPKLTGIDFLKSLKNSPAVIFTTAYEKYAIQGYELDITDYLVKPIPFSRFMKAVNKAKEFIEQKNKERSYEEDGYFFLKVDNKFEKILYDEILFVEALQNYVAIYTKDKKMLSYITLSNIEKQLPPGKFLKVHKSYIVALDKIKTVEANIIVIHNHQVPISRSMKEDVMQKVVLNKLLKR